MFTYYLGIGSNLGDKFGSIKRVYTRLAGCDHVLHLESASMYESEPMYVTKQPHFLNTVFRCVSTLSVFPFFYFCQSLETALGRTRSIRNGPRNIDIDIILAAQAIVRTKELVIPHPRCTERRFVLEPLLELNDKLVHPVEQNPLISYLGNVRANTVTKIRSAINY